MSGRPDYQLSVWLGHHPWAWALITLIGIGCFVAWLAGPVTWENGEGSIVEDGKRFANSLRQGDSPLRWLWGAAKSLNDRKK
ncbi:MAG: hypothetical protein QM758_08600 [Armatimonas sp.]